MRKKPPIDWSKVERLAAIFCPGEEIANVLDVSYDVLARRCLQEKKIPMAEYLAKNRGMGRAALRNMQMATARKGQVAMQIWLGKQMLGQAEPPVRLDAKWAAKQDPDELMKQAEEAMAVMKAEKERT